MSLKSVQQIVLNNFHIKVMWIFLYYGNENFIYFFLEGTMVMSVAGKILDNKML